MAETVNPSAWGSPHVIWDALIDEAGCAVLVVNRHGDILFANSRTHAWLQGRAARPDPSKSLTLADACPAASLDERLAIVRRVCDEAIPIVYESVSRNIRYLVSLRPITGGEGDDRAALVIARRLRPWERVTPAAYPHAAVIEVERHDPGVLATLSPRELDVLILIGEGLSSADIAKRLHRSVRTIERHRDRLGQKLGVSNRVDIARFAIRAGLAELPEPPDAAKLAKTPHDPLEISDPIRRISRRRVRKAE